MKHNYFISYLFALLVLPISVAAQDEPDPQPVVEPDELYFDGTDILANPNALGTLPCIKGGSVTFDADSKTLTLTDAILEATSEYIIDSKMNGLTIVLNGANTICAGFIRLYDTDIVGGTEGSSLIGTDICYILTRSHALNISSTYISISAGGQVGIDNREGTLTLNDVDLIIQNAKPAVLSTSVVLNSCTPTSSVPGGISFDTETGTFKVKGATLGNINFVADNHYAPNVITLSPMQDTYYIYSGLEATFAMPSIGVPDDYTGILTYSSSNPECISITTDGKPTFNTTGTTTITVSASAMGKYLKSNVSFRLTYGKRKPDLYFTKTTLTLPLTHNYTDQLPSLVYSGNGKLSYSTSNPDVMDLDNENGIHLMGVGTATITVTATETELYQAASASFTCTVTAAPEQKPSQIHWINFNGNAINVEIGQESQYYSGYPLAAAANGYDGRIYYTSSKPSCIHVDYDYGTLTFRKTGTVTITATAPATDYFLGSSISYTINYYEPTPDPVLPDMAFTVTQLSVQEGEEGLYNGEDGSQWPKVTINSDYDGSIRYSSSNPDCINVDENTGRLMFVAFGTAEIIATAAANERYLEATASYTVTYEAAPDLRPEPELAFITEQVEVTFMADGKVKIPLLMMQYSGDAPLSFASSDERVVSVEEDGLLYITGEEGMATITVTAPETDTWKAASTTLEIRVADQTAVQVGQVKGHRGSEAVYDLNGRRIKRAPQQGIYITAGRKTAVR